MVFAEGTTVIPMIMSDAWHRGAWKQRERRNWAKLFGKGQVAEAQTAKAA
jgi:deoxyhypusine synthase